MRIIFVCTGNTCRSSMAEALAKRWVETNVPTPADIEITSAGLAAYPGLPASPHATDVMHSAGLDLANHRARQFSRDIAEHNDFVIAMTEGHKHTLQKLHPEMAFKIFTIGELAGRPGFDVADPFGQPVETYEKCARELQELIDEALHKIFKQTGHLNKE